MKSEVRTEGNRFQITRVFNAPRALVFSWWTTAEKYQQWSGCNEAVDCKVVMDFRVGGSFTQKMKILAHGKICDFIVTGTYLEIVEPVRIVYDAGLGPVPVRVTVEFFEQDEATNVVITQDGLPDEFFAGNVSRGTSDSFDKLEPLLAAQFAQAIR